MGETRWCHPIRARRARRAADTLGRQVSTTQTSEAERMLRGLAEGDETLLRSVLVPSARALPPATSALVHLAGLLAAGGSTTSLRWATERATRAGAREEEIVEVLATVAAAVGSARVVAAAPRLALALGYDIEVEGWDGD